MNDESKTLEQERLRGEHAKQVLHNPAYVEAWGLVEARLKELRVKVPIGDQNAHTRLIMLEQLMGQLKEHFEQAMQTGKLATIQIQTEESRLERLAKAGMSYLRGR